MKLDVRPVTPALWPALEDLFGKPGASNGCWCMYWRIGGRYRDRPREQNRDALKRIVTDGPPPGLLAFEGETAVGWCQVTPRSDLPWLEQSWWLERVDERPVWSISCFFVRRGFRHRGVTAALIDAAVKLARRAGAPAVEAYPSEASGAYTGYVSTFARAGFVEVARRRGARPILRRELRRSGGATGSSAAAPRRPSPAR
jgi:GNAT superfamily N-acetyltransferase